MPRKSPSASPVPTGEPTPEFYTGQEVATVFRVPYDTVEYWRRTKTMTGPLGVTVGRRVLYPRRLVHKLIDELIAAQTGGAA